MATLLTSCRLIDGTGTPARDGETLLLEGDRVTALGPTALDAAAGRTDVERIDVAGMTVMPGLIDAHCHVTLGEPQSNDELFHHRDEATAALLAAFNVQKLLRAGVTGFLDADGVYNVGPALRIAIEAGLVEGPRMASGANALMTSVGGTAGNLIPDEGRAGYAEVVTDKDAIVRAVRGQVKRGTDWIKVHVTGRAPRHDREMTVWSVEELKLVAETAHELDTPVVGHCRNSASTRDAARAGFDLIYHASFMDEEALEAVVEHKTALAPTSPSSATSPTTATRWDPPLQPRGSSPRRSSGQPPWSGAPTTPACPCCAARRAASPSRPTATGTHGRWSCSSVTSV